MIETNHIFHSGLNKEPLIKVREYPKKERNPELSVEFSCNLVGCTSWNIVFGFVNFALQHFLHNVQEDMEPFFSCFTSKRII